MSAEAVGSRQAPATGDPLSNILDAYRLRAHVFAHQRLCGAWSVDTSGSGRASFHIVGDGAAQIRLRGADAPLALAAGDMVVMPHDAPHDLGPADAVAQAAEWEAGTYLLCGYFDFGDGRDNPVLASLPEVIVVRAEDPSAHRVAVAVRMLVGEALCEGPGHQLILDRLSDVIFVELLRQRLAQPGADSGLLGGLADARIRRALECVHAQPAYPWQVETLARAAAMSRTAFALRFAQLLGQPPLAYLTAVRMRQAAWRLRESGVSVAAVAEELGFATEPSFRRAFKRYWGCGPGRYRRGAETPTAPTEH